MDDARGKHRERRLPLVVVAPVVALIATAALACGRQEPGKSEVVSAVLRVGVSGLSPTNPIAGLRQLSQILSVEGLARLSEDGRPEPSLAERWNFASDGRTLLVRLKAGVKFHDGSSLSPQVVASVLPVAMRQTFGPVADDVERISVVDTNTVEIRFRRPSPFLLESLEAGIRKPGSTLIGTGPFVAAPNSTSDLHANADYYAGRPQISDIHVETFPAVRTAWAKLLRNELDMLWEVGPDALSSLEHSANVAVFTFTRRYQYIVALNTESPALRSPTVRRALNMAIDRAKLVRDALNGHGIPSASPIWPRYWALDTSLQQYNPYSPQQAADALARSPAISSKRARVHFTLLIPSDAVYERIALEVKRQLDAVGVDMDVQAASHDQLFDAEHHGRYEAVLIEAISGPTLLRPYGLWHSKSAGNPGNFGNRAIDVAFDRVRGAASEGEYRAAVGNLHHAFADDPPAISLAWSVRARAVTTRFEVPAEEGRDVLSTLRLWKPTGAQQRVSRN
jgi:peptide/nickel transport system substrate-binding protein